MEWDLRVCPLAARPRQMGRLAVGDLNESKFDFSGPGDCDGGDGGVCRLPSLSGLVYFCESGNCSRKSLLDHREILHRARADQRRTRTKRVMAKRLSETSVMKYNFQFSTGVPLTLEMACEVRRDNDGLGGQ